jgi:serine/threonine-protein kinase
MHDPLESDPITLPGEQTAEGSGELPVIAELQGDYELIRELGRGGTAVVYLAREKELGRLVAIKLMHQSHVQDEEAIARLVREAKTISRLQHPNIVMLYGTRRLVDRGYALILQYVPGKTVKQRLRESGPFPLPLVERIINDLGAALQYAHQHRIVHRDIKPENIFIDEDTGAARLADFGIARFWDSDSGLTLPGTAMGTPNYMSPEQVDGRRDLDGRSDIYSIGLVAWEMATGQQPWAGETLYNVVYKQKHEQLPSLEQLRPDMPHYFRNAIEGALKKIVAERWRDAGELLAAMQNPYANMLMQAKSQPLPQQAREQAAPPPRERPASPVAPVQEPQAAQQRETAPARPYEPRGMDDTETIVMSRAELDRSLRRAPSGGTAPPRPKSPPSPPAAEPRNTQRPAREPVARKPPPPAPAAAPPLASPTSQETSSQVFGGRTLKDRLKPPSQTRDPNKPLPGWLAEVESGRVSSGPWSLDLDRPQRLSQGIIAFVVIVAVVLAIAGVIAFF